MSKPILLLGWGLSTKSVARLLKQQQRPFKVFVEKDPEKKDVDFISSKDDVSRFLPEIGFAIVSPGFSPQNEIVQLINNQKIPLLTDLDYCLGSHTGKRVLITGTNGKSTVTAMLAHTLNQCEVPAVACGNIGKPVAEAILESPQRDFAIELSSYQLHYSRPISGQVKIVTSLAPDHLEWHQGMQGYLQAKSKIFAETSKDTLALLTQGVFEAFQKHQLPTPKNQRTKILKEYLPVVEQLKSSNTVFQPGHNLLNASFVYLACKDLYPDISTEKILEVLSSYQPLAHRCQPIHLSKACFKVFNDSKATNVAAALTSASSIQGPLVLILGGVPKGDSFSAFKTLSEKIDSVLAYGQAAEKIFEELRNNFTVRCFSSLSLLVESLDLSECQNLNKNILFAPGCASFDEFQNFEERGDFFSSAIQVKWNQLDPP